MMVSRTSTLFGSPGRTLERTDQVLAGQAVRWELQRNCALSPRHTLRALGVLVALGAGVAALACLVGYPVVALFSCLAQLAVGAAFVAYARHAVDRDTVTLDHHGVHLRRCCGLRATMIHVDLYALRVEGPHHAQGPWLVGGSTRVDIGAHVPEALRPVLAQELRAALRVQRMRHACAPPQG